MVALTLDLMLLDNTMDQCQKSPQIITDFGNFTLDFCASPVFLQTSDHDFQMKCKIYFYLKRGLWTTEQQSRGLIYKACVHRKPALKEVYATSYAKGGIYKNKLDGKICTPAHKLTPATNFFSRSEKNE